jgi:hypothetical protein
MLESLVNQLRQSIDVPDGILRPTFDKGVGGGQFYNASEVNCVCYKFMRSIAQKTGLVLQIVKIDSIFKASDSHWIMSIFVTQLSRPELLLEMKLETSSDGIIWSMEFPALTKYNHFDEVQSFDLSNLKDFDFLTDSYHTSSLQRLQDAYRQGISLAQTLSTGDLIPQK